MSVLACIISNSLLGNIINLWQLINLKYWGRFRFETALLVYAFVWVCVKQYRLHGTLPIKFDFPLKSNRYFVVSQFRAVLSFRNSNCILIPWCHTVTCGELNNDIHTLKSMFHLLYYVSYHLVRIFVQMQNLYTVRFSVFPSPFPSFVAVLINDWWNCVIVSWVRFVA